MANQKKIYRMTGRLILYTTAIFLIVFVGAFLLLQTQPVRGTITRIIEETVAQNTRAVCRIEKLSGNLLSRFEINGVELKDAKTGNYLMTARRIDISYSVPMLLGRVLWINRLTIDGVAVNLLESPDGTWNFEMLVSAYSSGNPPEPLPEDLHTQASGSFFPDGFKIEIRRLTIGNSEVTLTQQTDTGKTIRRFRGIQCQARLDVGDRIFAKIRRLAVSADDPRLDIRDLSGNIRYDVEAARLYFKDVRIIGEKSDFTVNGGLEFYEQGANMAELDWVYMDLRAAIRELSLGEFGRAFPIDMPDSDIVYGDISVKGPVSKMDCRVDLHMDECHVISRGMVFIDDAYNVDLDIAGNIKHLDLSALPVLDLKSFPGDLNSDFSLNWRKIAMPEQTGKILLDLKSSDLWDYKIEKSKIVARIDGPDFKFGTFNLKTPYGKFTGNGLLAGFMASDRDNLIQLKGDVEGLNPEKLIKNSQYSGDVNGNVRTSIFIPKTFDEQGITADTTCRISPSRMMDTDILSADLDASWQDEKITVKRFDMETAIGSADLTGTASVKDKTCRFKASTTLTNLTPVKQFIPEIKDDEPLSGNVSVAAAVEGSWEEPHVSATLNGTNIVFREVSADSISAAGDWQGSLKEFQVDGKCRAEKMHVNGLRIFSADLETTLTPESLNADINAFGMRKEEFSLSGKIFHWPEPVKEILIEKMVFSSPDQPPLVNREPIKLSISPDRIIVDSLHLDSGNASFVLKGRAGINPASAVSADLTLADFNLKRIAGFWEGGEKIQGKLSSEIQLSGIMEKPVIHMTTFLKDVSCEGWPVTDLSVAVRYKDSKLNLTGSGVRQGNAYLDINGSASADLALYPFKFIPRPESLIAAVNLNQVDISEFSNVLLGTDQLKGRLSSNIKLTGELQNPDIDVRLSVTGAALDRFVVSEADASIVYSDSKAQITAAANRQDKKLLEISGFALIDLSIYPFKFIPEPDGLDLTLNADQVDISWISDIINDPEYDISGFVNAAGSVSGDVYRPRVQGRMRLSDGSLHLKKQQLVYNTLNTELRFDKNTLTIVDLNLKGDKEGSLKLSGVVTHNNFKPETFNLRAVGNQLYIPFHSGVDARINPDLTLSGTWEAPVLSGKIKVPEGRVNLKQFLEKQLSDIEIVAPVRAENGVLQIPEKEPEPLEFVDPLAADVNVTIPNDFWFKGEDEFIEIKGKVRLKKDPEKPFVLYGSVSPVRGTYRFRGRIFQITQGELTFFGQEDINPAVNIEASSVIADVKIIIRLTGTFEHLNIVLDSDPAMDQSAIISYLVFGRGPDDLSEKESFQAGEAALSYTGQIAADKLSDIIGDPLGIDYLNINAGSDGLRQGSLTMGKYVLPKVFVTFRQGFDETVTQKLEVTYEINKNFDLETQIDNEQTSALDLIWKYEF